MLNYECDFNPISIIVASHVIALWTQPCQIIRTYKQPSLPTVSVNLPMRHFLSLAHFGSEISLIDINAS